MRFQPVFVACGTLIFLAACSGKQGHTGDITLPDADVGQDAAMMDDAAVDMTMPDLGPVDLGMDMRDTGPADTCSGAGITSRVGAVIFGGSTAVQADYRFSSCGGVGAPDATFAFQAPSAGTYTFDTIGSRFNTVLYVQSSCVATPSQCNDDGVGIGNASSITMDLRKNALIYLVVDGKTAADQGPFVINVSETTPVVPPQITETCQLAAADTSLYSGPGMFSGTTIFAQDDTTQSDFCGTTAPDIAFLWQATMDGLYNVSVTSPDASYSPSLEILPTNCSPSASIACLNSVFSSTSMVIGAVANQQLVFVVDGASPLDGSDPSQQAGSFTVTVTRMGDLPPAGVDDECVAMGRTFMGTGSPLVTGVTYALQPSARMDCATGTAVVADAGVDMGADAAVDGGDVDAGVDAATTFVGTKGDGTFLWVAPDAGIFTFDSIGSSESIAIAAYAGACGGTVLACDDDSQFNNDTFESYSQVSVRASTAGQQFQIWIDDVGSSGGVFTTGSPDHSFLVNVTQASTAGHTNFPDVCSNSMSPSTSLGGSVLNSDTLLSFNQMRTSCDAPGPDSSFLWQAPSTGSYTFDTVGSDFDTVLAIYDMTCAGPLLSCDDNSAMDGVRSSATVTLSAGELVQVFVDGASAMAEGHAIVNIHMAPAVGSSLQLADYCGSAAIPMLTTIGTGIIMDLTTNYANDPRSDCDDDGADGVFEWVAPTTGMYTIDAARSAFFATVAVYKNTCGGGHTFACSQSDTTSLSGESVTFAATMGDVFYVFIDSFADESGRILVDISAH